MDLLTEAYLKVRELGSIFIEAGAASDVAIDLRRVKRHHGDAHAALLDIRARNRELEALADQIETTPDAKSLRQLFGAPGDRETLGDYHRLHVPGIKLSPIGGDR